MVVGVFDLGWIDRFEVKRETGSVLGRSSLWYRMDNIASLKRIYEVGQETGLKFVHQNSRIVPFDKTPTQSTGNLEKVNSAPHKLQGEWVQAFSATISGNGWTSVTYNCLVVAKQSQKSLHLKFVHILHRVSDVGNWMEVD